MQKTITIKVGTNVLTNNSNKISLKIIRQIVKQITVLIEKGYKIILVSSGAVGCGREILNIKSKDEKINRSLLAAVGQAGLMKIYNQEFSKYKIKTAQLLLTREDFTIRSHYLNLKNILKESLEKNILPIINENDVVSTYEITFGDNDLLASNISITTESDYLFILSSINGLYSADPKKDQSAKLISEINDISKEIERYASVSTSSLGIGGMSSKLNAIKLANKSGVECYILNGTKDDIINRVLLKKEKLGTKFKAQNKNLSNKQRWLLIGSTMAKIFIDDGAKKALLKRKSLLLVGVNKILGDFSKGEIAEILDNENNAIGYGIINFPSIVLKKFLKKPKEIKKEIIHANNMTLL